MERNPMMMQLSATVGPTGGSRPALARDQGVPRRGIPRLQPGGTHLPQAASFGRLVSRLARPPGVRRNRRERNECPTLADSCIRCSPCSCSSPRRSCWSSSGSPRWPTARCRSERPPGSPGGRWPSACSAPSPCSPRCSRPATATWPSTWATGYRSTPTMATANHDYHFSVKFVFDRLSVPFAILSFVLCGTIGAFATQYMHRERGYQPLLRALLASSCSAWW